MNTLLQNLFIPTVADKPSRPAMHLRVDETRAYEVGPDSLRGQLWETLEVNPISPCFRSGVRGAGGKPRKGFYGSNVDDSTTAMLHAEKGAFEVDVENPVPFLLRQIRDSGELPLNARVVWRRTRIPR